MPYWLFKLIPLRFFSKQARKPSGLFGRYVMTRLFNIGNAEINAFVLQSLTLQKTDRVLEIGYGPGLLIQDMAIITTDGQISGIDYSIAMYQQASMANQLAIAQGKVQLQHGECSTLPYENSTFDKACCVNVIYFWRHPEQNLREIHRVLKPGGRIVIGFRDADQMNQLPLSEDIFNNYSQNDVLDLLSNSGFKQPLIAKESATPFDSYCAIASKE